MEEPKLDEEKLLILASKWLRRPVKKIIGFHYDEEADVLAIHLRSGVLADMEPLDDVGDAMAQLDENDEIIGLTFMNASRYLAEISSQEKP